MGHRRACHRSGRHRLRGHIRRFYGEHKDKDKFFGDGESSRHTFKNANFFAVFWNRIQLKPDPDPAKTLNPDPDQSYFLTLSEKKKNTS